MIHVVVHPGILASMGALSPRQFGPDTPLPGMTEMRQAEPHEQTESQFLNRPDVFVHGRFVTENTPLNKVPVGSHDEGFHAGTEAAAMDRIEQMGRPFGETQRPRFFAGRVDPSRMQNPPPSEGPHYHPGQVMSTEQGALTNGTKDRAEVLHEADNEWRVEDEGHDWTPVDHDSYYRNEYEAPGSTSVILSPGKNRNFQSWRGAVSDAIKAGRPVPAHVRGVYEASGGAGGSKAYFRPDQRPAPSQNAPRDASAAIYGPEQVMPHMSISEVKYGK